MRLTTSTGVLLTDICLILQTDDCTVACSQNPGFGVQITKIKHVKTEVANRKDHHFLTVTHGKTLERMNVTSM